MAGAAPERAVDHDRRGPDRRGVPPRGDQRGGPGCPGARRLEGLALHHGGALRTGCAVGLHPAGQHLLRARLRPRADPDLLRHLRDRPRSSLAFWVSGSDRVYALAQRTFLILFWVGFFALFRGFTQIMLAFAVRHAGTEAVAVDAAGPR